MSDQVQLSAYTEAIENLIRSEQYDQAIALCQHILSYYPKNIVTYRQMAQANLEKGDPHSAAELFRRVLSADPEEYVAYAGLGIIFEGQSLIDEAVWHLERAFELRPNIPQIRDELLRLYSERDGRPQTRLRLTPGALARLYVREGLFTQAIQEFRGILAQAPRRLDVRLALAETLWHAGQMRDATQVCQEILQALPNCLKANLILGKALQESGADAGEPYLRCAQALDPTNQVAQEIFGEQSPLHPAEVLVPQFVERPGPAPAAAGAPPTAEQAPEQQGGFDDWFPEESPERFGFGAPNESPSAGGATDRTTAPFEQWPVESEPAAEQPPAWVSELTVQSEPAESPAPENVAADQVAPTPEAAPPESQPGPELPPWLLSDFVGTPSLGAPPAAAPKPTIPASSSLPPWLTEFQKTHQVDSSTEGSTEERKQGIPSESLPDWAVGLSEESEAAAASPAAEEKTSTSEPRPFLGPTPPAAEIGRSAEQPVTGELPEEQAVLGLEPTESSAPTPAPFEIQAGSTPEETAPVVLPNWIEAIEAQVNAESADTAPSATEERPPLPIPDWLKGLQEAIPQEAAARAEEGVAEEPREQEAQPVTAAEPRDEVGLETQAQAAPPLPQEEVAAEGGLVGEVYAPEGESRASGALATEAQVEPVDVETAEIRTEGESETVVLEEEPGDRELYGDQTSAGAPQTQEAADEIEAQEPIPAEPATPPPAEASTREELPPAEFLRRRRDPKGYSQLVQARALCEDNRLGEALKEYDHLVQHSPRLVNAVIEDLEGLVQREDVPLEAHRILGDAYTRADRLAEALERYRFVLERVS